ETGRVARARRMTICTTARMVHGAGRALGDTVLARQFKPHGSGRGIAMLSNPTEVRPFRVDVPEAELTELRRRIAATRWPEKEPVEELSQGVQLAAIQALARYWETEYDFGRLEARLSGLPQFMTEIDGLDIQLHPCHVAARGRAPAPDHARLARLDRR